MTIHVNNSSAQPLYEQIVEQVRRQVLEGILKDGDQLPSIRALAKDLRVSIITTKRAYEELEREGILAVSAGRGTFVRARGIESSRQSQMAELREELGRSAKKGRMLGLSQEEFACLAGEAFEKEESQ